ncbi:unnamed protein product [Malus baccata var. baccata]
MEASPTLSSIGLAGLAVMGQNLALNIAEKGFPISIYNRTTSKVDETVERAHNEGNLPLSVIILVKAEAPVDQTIVALSAYMEPGDAIIDGGNDKGGSSNFVKMVHNEIKYGNMQLISEPYDVLKNVRRLMNEELSKIFLEWNRGELESFLVEITADIFMVPPEAEFGCQFEASLSLPQRVSFSVYLEENGRARKDWEKEME